MDTSAKASVTEPQVASLLAVEASESVTKNTAQITINRDIKLESVSDILEEVMLISLLVHLNLKLDNFYPKICINLYNKLAIANRFQLQRHFKQWKNEIRN